ncbi:hypothetical protein [uncultured Pseudoteredinibacter sp.]|uniref:hypothetical protein n=1 Tax=uncultured Pseudoteredinibacter sp. TaxID=1641701 RepID=UPI0026205E4A|nr:hypothetical protein [uncultured Pseudoteredinibacter sp.]
MNKGKYKNILTAEVFSKKYVLAVSESNVYTIDEFNQWLAEGGYDLIDFEDYRFGENKGLFSPDGRGISFNYVTFPPCDVSFKGAEFEGHYVSFCEATFGEGDVDFSGSKFIGREVVFSDTTFSSGRVSFENAVFDVEDFVFSELTFESGVSFSCAVFNADYKSFSRNKYGQGLVDFSHTTFADGEVYFSRSCFGLAGVHFYEAAFGDGVIEFRNCSFGRNNTLFCDVLFGKGGVYFVDSTFEGGGIDFSNAKFGDGGVDFSGAKLNTPIFSFKNATFGEGDLVLAPKYFQDGIIDLSYVRCAGRMFLSGISGFSGNIYLESAEFGAEVKVSSSVDESVYRHHRKPTPLLGSISFNSAKFEKGLVAEGSYRCPIDFRNTDIKGHFSLDNFNVELQRRGPFYRRVAICDQSAGRFRRLKDLADQARNKELSLQFHASELKALRWHHQGAIDSILDMIYSGVCDYGRSVARPLITLGFLTLLCGLYYSGWSLEKIKPAADLSLANAFPYLSKGQAKESLGLLNPGLKGSFIYTLVRVGQGFGSSILLFLTGLGLRNRFRV